MKKPHFLIGTFLLCVVNVLAQYPTIQITGSTSSPRVFHESQVLPNGSVLTFGGDNGDYITFEAYRTAEVYDLVTGTWYNTGSMNSKRSDFSSAVLPNGNIMAIGGHEEDFSELSSCEIYNTTTGTWSNAASMQQSRQNHEAITLWNGKVLVVGGAYNDNRTELYDPITNTWSYTGSLSAAKGAGVSLVMLNDGKVLATGGSQYSSANIGEIYDPGTQTWTLVSYPMRRSRAYHSSILLQDGRVLIVGSGNASHNDQINPEIFDPVTNTFSNAATMLSNVGHSEMGIMDDGRVLVYGIGDFFTPDDMKTLQVYDPVLNQWSADRYSFIGANVYRMHRLNNGKFLIIAGNWTTGNGATDQCILVTQPGYTSCTSPNTFLSVNGAITCLGKDVSISIPSSQSGVSYRPCLLSGEKAGNIVNGGGSIILTIPAENLSEGKNVIRVEVQKSGCASRFLNDTAIVQVYQTPTTAPVITPSGDLSFCPGGSVTLTSTAGNVYLWSDGQTSQSITVNKSGTFSVRLVDASGCASPATEVQTVLFNNTITAGANESTCTNIDPYTLSGAYPPGGLWTGTGVSADGIFDPALAGEGIHTLTYSKCSKTASKVVTVIANPVIPDFTINSLVDSVCINGNTSIRVNNPVSGIAYQLRFGTTNIGTAKYSSSTPINLATGSIPLTRIFNVRATQGNSCGVAELIKEDTVHILPNPVSKVIVTQDTICMPAASTIFKIANSDLNTKYRVYNAFYTTQSYYWGNGDTLTLTGPPPNTDASNKWINFKIQATNSQNCAIVDIMNKPITGFYHQCDFTLQPGYFLGENVQLVNNSNGDFYSWTFDNTSTLLSSSTPTPPEYKYNDYGLKEVELISVSKYGCKDTTVKHTFITAQAPGSPGKACFLDTVSSNPTFVNFDEYSVMDLHTDANNNTYVAGYSHTGYHGGNYSGSYGSYLKKLDPSGNMLWELKQNVGMYGNNPKYHSVFFSSITTDADGNVYITGSFGNTYLNIAGLSTPNQTNFQSQAFILKLNSDGIGQWLVYGTDPDNRECGGTNILFVDDAHIYVSLYNARTMKFTDGISRYFGTWLNIVQIDKNGKFQRDFSVGGMSFLKGSFTFNPDLTSYNTGKIVPMSPRMKLGENGKIIVAGRNRETKLVFGSSTVTGVTNYLTNYVAVLDTVNGWERAFPTYSQRSNLSHKPFDHIPHFTTDQQNNIYVVSYYNRKYQTTHEGNILLPDYTTLGDTSGSFIAKYDVSGNLLWYNHSALNYPVGIEYLPGSDQIITYGFFDNDHFSQMSQNISPVGIKSSGGSDAYLTSFSTVGDVNWVEKIGSVSNDEAYAITSNSCNDICILGKFENRGGIKTDSLIYSNDKTFFARFSPSSACGTVCNQITTPLKASLYSIQETRTNLSPIPLYVKFNKNVNDFTQTDLVVNNATISGFSGSGSDYVIYLVPIAESVLISAQLPANTVTDGSQNNLVSNLFQIKFDSSQPTITLSSTSSGYVKTSPVTITVASDDELIEFTASDLQLTNAVVKTFTGRGKNFTITIEPQQEGSFSITVPASVAVDSAGNNNVASNSITKIYDITRPTAVITTTASNPTGTSPIPISITFSEPVQNLTLGSFIFTYSGPTVTNLQNPSGDMKTFTAEINCTATSQNKIFINNNYVQDLAGNGNVLSDLSFYYDVAKPTVTLTSTAPATTATKPIPVSIKFSKEVFGLNRSSFTVTNGEVTGLTGNGTTYTAEITPAASGTVSIFLPAGAVQDTVGNTNALSSTLSRNYDIERPTVTVSTTASNPTRISPIPISFTFSENVTGFTVADIFVTNGTAGNFSGSGKNYTAKITPSGQGTVTISVTANVAQDAVLNWNLPSNILGLKYDNVRPTVSITSSAGNPTSTPTIPLTINFSEEVIDFTLSDIISNNAILSNFTGSGSQYSVDVSPVSNGDFGISISAGIATDLATNMNLSGTYSNTYQGIDNTKPNLTISTMVSSPTNQSSFSINFTFDESVTEFTSDDIVVINAVLSGFSGNGNTYSALLTPVSEGNISLTVLDDVATDGASNGNNGSSFNIVYDITKPIASITTTENDPTSSSSFTISFTFSEPIYVFSSDDIQITNGALNSLTGSGTTYTATLTPGADGLVMVSLNSSGIFDIAGNNCESSSFSITYSNPTNSVGTGIINGSFRVFPNPVHTELTLIPENSSLSYEVNILNLQGKSVYSDHLLAGSAISGIDVSFLNEGVYYLQITQGNDVLHQLIVIEH